MRSPAPLIVYAAMLACLGACRHTPYVAKPISPQTSQAKLLAKSPLSADFLAFCKQQSYAGALPFSAWGIDELTLSAQFYHTKLDVAKAQLGVAKAAITSAGMRPEPILGGTVARSNQANGDIRPYAYGLNVEIPIETANKRGLRAEEAQHLAEAARLDVADTAWGLRHALKQDWLNYHENMILSTQLSRQHAQQQALLNLIEKRVQKGLASNSELNLAKTQALKTQTLLMQTQQQRDTLVANMAANAGLSLAQFSQIPIATLNIDDELRTISQWAADPAHAQHMQDDALLNRIDVRRSLAKYAAAESKIKLEVAKQTPDISLTPGFIFEFGDKVWSLGFASLLNLLNKNPRLIHEAEALRAVEGAQFEAVQAQVIAEVSLTQAQLQSAQNQLNRAYVQKNQQLAALKSIQKQFDAGLIDKLELTLAQTQLGNYQDEVENAQFALLRAAAQLENILQRPLNPKNSPL